MSCKIAKAQNGQGLMARYALARGCPTPKAYAQDGTPIQWEHSHLTSTKMEGPSVVEKSLYLAPHQRMT